MPIRISGITSGLDTESIVKQMVSGQQAKIDKLSKNKTTVEWKQEAWSTINKSIYSFYTGALSKVKTFGNYKSKSATISDETAAKITTTNGTSAGTYKMKVKQLASSAFLTGSSVSSHHFTTTSNAGNKTKFSDTNTWDSGLNSIVGQKISFAVTQYDRDDSGAILDTRNTNFDYEFTADSSVEDINKKLGEAGITGITASMNEGKLTFNNVGGFEATNGVVARQNTEATISGSALASLGFSSTSFDMNISSTHQADGSYTYNNSVGSTNALIVDTPDSKLTQDSKVSDYFTDDTGHSLFEGAATNADGVRVIKVKINDEEVELKESDKISDFTERLSKHNVTARFDDANQRFFITSSKTGAENDFTISSDGSAKSDSVLSAFGLTGSGVSKVDASDCRIELNGAELTSTSNIVEVKGLGLTIEALSDEHPDDDVTIQVNNDTKGIYDMVKDFVTQYNALVTSLSEKYYAKKNSYKPLTEEEKQGMTDTQINKWEDKAKEALLRRDSTVESLMSSMRTALAKGVKMNDSKTGREINSTLSSLGIKTGEYTEHGLLHIDGDKDDATVSGNDNTLMDAIENDPEKVMNTIANLAQGMYDDLGKAMKSTTLSSAMTVYNDKSMKTEVSDYEKQIKQMQTKLTEMEDRYYAQFAAMEKAMTKIQSTQSSLFGGTSS